MYHTIALFSDLGLDVIVDHVILDTPHEQNCLRECIRLLHTHPVLFVRVDCPLEELERREQLRSDRRPGQARAQFDKIHGHGVYDLTVDTYLQTLETCANQIIAALSHPERWSAFRSLHQRWTN
jgi:chloramphenicol 3-O phosphotransferase